MCSKMKKIVLFSVFSTLVFVAVNAQIINSQPIQKVEVKGQGRNNLISHFVIGVDTFVSISSRDLKSKYEELPGEFAGFYQVVPINVNDRSLKLAALLNKGEFHVGPICVSDANKMVFVTRNLSMTKEKKIRLGLFAVKFDDQWNFISEQPLKVNNIGYSVGYPYFVSSTNELLFASDKGGGYGKFDIYSLKLDSLFTSAGVLLDSTVNTTANELFPSAYQSTLFLTSDRTGVLRLYSKGKDIAITTLPIEGAVDADFFGFQMLNDTQASVFSSIEGIDNYYTMNWNALSRVEKDLEITKIDSIPATTMQNTEVLIDTLIANVEQVKPKLEIGQDLGVLYGIGKINFNLGKWDITPSAAAELDKVAKILIENPEINIELGSHSDSRGKSVDNKILSEKRAQASAQYIVDKGVAAERVLYVGYGEERPLNTCKDGVVCSEEQHAINRRTEFIIINKK